MEILRTRIDSPSTHPRPTSGGAADFLPASALYATNEPCDSPVKKTRDASNRCLPPKRTACTRTSRVPGSLSQLSLRGRPTETKAPCGVTGGQDVSRRPRPLRRIVNQHDSRALLPHGLETRAWAFSSHGADGDRASDTPVAILIVSTLTPHPPSRALLLHRTSAF